MESPYIASTERQAKLQFFPKRLTKNKGFQCISEAAGGAWARPESARQSWSVVNEFYSDTQTSKLWKPHRRTRPGLHFHPFLLCMSFCESKLEDGQGNPSLHLQSKFCLFPVLDILTAHVEMYLFIRITKTATF